MNKQDLISKIKQLNGISKDERAYLIELVNTKTKYGLVWEDKPEAVEVQLRENLPVLKEVEEKAIINSEECPNHLLIEGDNLHALTALTFTHEGKIDVIYIDPPYNTGNKDFRYNDTFKDDFIDKENPFRHSTWLSFIDRRLKVAKRLLSDKGIIYISIDDNEIAQLKLLCDSIFGESNKIIDLVWFYEGVNDNQAVFRKTHEYILAYAKNSINLIANPIIDPNVELDSKIENSVIKNGSKNPPSKVLLRRGFPSELSEGVIRKDEVQCVKYSEDLIIKDNQLQKDVYVESGWSSKNILEMFIQNNFKGVLDSKGQVTKFLIKNSGNIHYYKKREQGYLLSVLRNLGTTQQSGEMLKEMGMNFSFPKPTNLIAFLTKIYSQKDSVILDFFAGSGTTLHSTMMINSEDDGKRQCILVTNNENNICEEVTYERNKRVIQGYTNAKGIEVEGLKNNNLRYYKSEYVSREQTLKNKRELTQLSTDLLCIKEDCYTEITANLILDTRQNWIKIFANQKSQFIVIYDDLCIEDGIPVIQQLHKQKTNDNNIKVYVFSNGQYPYTEDFEEVLPFITLCALPDAIYKAYQNVLPSKKQKPAALEEENTDESGNSLELN
jgi:adenine-specific DNA-methyltransferase